MWYKLDEEGNPVPVANPQDWAVWFETAGKKRVVEQNHTDCRFVSTVFLGIDMRYDEGAPLLFETMTFRKTNGEINWAEESGERYSTRDEAQQGHNRWLAKALQLDSEEQCQLPNMPQSMS